MVYQYKLPGLFSVPAQTAGDELSRIYHERGELQAADVVDESRPETAPLHPCFEWDDYKAAERYRQQQARNLIDCVVTVQETKSAGPVEVRAYVHTEGSYHPIQAVVTQKDMHDELVKSALRDVEAFQRRLETFAALKPAKELRRAVEKAAQELRAAAP